MERLTGRFTNGEAYCKNITHASANNIDNRTFVERAIEKLAQYEDMEEQGLLLRLKYKNGWIPCNKELPKEIMQDCLVTLKNGAVLQAMYSQVTNEFKMVCLHDVATFPDDNPVIAWRPMPSGYELIDENEM